MKFRGSKKNRKGRHNHKKQVLVVAYVAMPVFPAFDQGKPLYSKRFDVVDYHDPMKTPNKESWLKAQEQAAQECDKFIQSQSNSSKWWSMKKGLKTSFRYSTQQIKAVA